jgi:MurNAc alpha-1-phosphate uridylyltransferase
MSVPVTRAMIMAAGLGSRMRPLTDTRPKPLIAVAGKALIDHSLDRLAQAGVTRVVVNVHYKAQMVRDHLANRHDLEIVFSDESDRLLDTGGGAVKALPLFQGQPFFILNSDSIWIEDGVPALVQMQKLWDPAAMDALLLLARRGPALGYDGKGDFRLDDAARLSRVPKDETSPYAYPGVQIVHPRLFASMPDGPFSTNLAWNQAIASGRLFGTVLDGVWLHVGTPEAVIAAEARLKGLA